MFRGFLAFGLLLLLTAPAAAEPPSGRISALHGTLEVSRKTDDVFTLRVFTLAPCGFPELLAEQEIGRGSFRVLFPVPESEYFALVTSGRHQPVVRRFRAGRRDPRFAGTIRPVEPRTVPVTVREDGGAPIPRAVVSAWSIPGVIQRFVDLPWLRTRATAGPAGTARVPWVAGGLLRLSTEGARTLWREIDRPPPAFTLLRRPRPAVLRLGAYWWPPDESRWETVDRRELIVAFRVDGRWVPASWPPDREGRLPAPAGWDAVRVREPRFRPWLGLKGDAKDVGRMSTPLEQTDPARSRLSTLTVQVDGLGVPIAADHWCGT